MPYIIDTINERVVNTDQSYIPDIEKKYPMNDLGSVFTHWDNDIKKNIPTENTLKEDNK